MTRPAARHPPALVTTLACAVLLTGCEREHDGNAVAPHPPGHADASTPTDVLTPAPRVVATLQCAAPEHDFGAVAEGEVREHRFELTNAGSESLVIHSVTSQCGCTVACLVRSDGEKIVPPGNGVTVPGGLLTIGPSGTCGVIVSFNSRNQPAGTAHKVTTIQSSDPAQPSLALAIKAEVQRAFTLDPSALQFGEVRRGESKTARVAIRSDLVKAFTVTGIEGAPAWLTWRAEPIEGGVALDLTVGATAPCGLQQQNLVILSSDPKFRSVALPMYADVRARIRFDTGNPENRERIDFGLIDPARVTTRTIDVVNEEPRVPCHVLAAEVDSPQATQFVARVETVKDGERYRVVLESTPTGANRTLRGVLRIRTDHPDLERRDLPFQAWVRSSQ